MALPKISKEKQFDINVGNGIQKQYSNIINETSVPPLPKSTTKNPAKNTVGNNKVGVSLDNNTQKVDTGLSNVKQGTQDHATLVNTQKEEAKQPVVAQPEPVAPVEEEKEEIVEEPVATETKDTTAEDETRAKYWQEIQNQIRQNTLNSKNEVANAQRKAGASMDNYLKMLGIQGTGLGQSQYTNLASDYANKIADINANEQKALLDVEGQMKAEQDEINAKREAEEKEALAETKKAQDTKAEQALSLIGNGADPTTIINQLKSEGYDTTYIEQMYDAYQTEKANAETETAEAEKEQMTSNVVDMYGTIEGIMKSEDLSYEDYKNLEQVNNKLQQAYQSGDMEAMKEAYKEAENIAMGGGKLNSDYVETEETVNGTDGTYNINTMKAEDFADNGKLNDKEKIALDKLLEDAKKWKNTGEYDGYTFEVGYGAWDDYYVFDAKKGTFTKVPKKEGKNATNLVYIKDMYKDYVKESQKNKHTSSTITQANNDSTVMDRIAEAFRKSLFGN